VASLLLAAGLIGFWWWQHQMVAVDQERVQWRSRLIAVQQQLAMAESELFQAQQSVQTLEAEKRQFRADAAAQAQRADEVARQLARELAETERQWQSRVAAAEAQTHQAETQLQQVQQNQWGALADKLSTGLEALAQEWADFLVCHTPAEFAAEQQRLLKSVQREQAVVQAVLADLQAAGCPRAAELAELVRQFCKQNESRHAAHYAYVCAAILDGAPDDQRRQSWQDAERALTTTHHQLAALTQMLRHPPPPKPAGRAERP
jgi:chromosome segregation ATPase